MPRRAPAYVANLIPSLQAQGLSANAALGQLRSQGLGVNRQNFLRLWGATLREASIRERLSTGDLYATPTAEDIVQVPRPKARGYQYNVDVLVRDPLSGSFYFTPTSIVTPTLITKLEAIERASALLARMQAGSERGTPRGEIRMGGEVSSVLERVPEDEYEGL